MKKFLITFLVLVLMLSVFTITASADGGGIKIVVTADKSTVYPGQTITYTLSVTNPGETITSLAFDFKLPAGISFTAAESGDLSAFSMHNINLSPVQGDPTVTMSGGAKSGNFTIGTITGTVTNTVEVKDYAFSISELVIKTQSSESYNSGSSELSGATVTVSHGDKDSDYHNYPEQPTSKVEPTCQKEGTNTYKCQTPGCNSEKTENVDKLEHKWQGPPTWNWNACEAPYSDLKATLTCSGNGTSSHTVEKAATVTVGETTATCTQTGDIPYNAEVTFGTGDDGNGETYKDTKNVSDGVLGHDWGTEKIDWDESDPKNAKATLTVQCKRSGCQYNTSPYTASMTVEQEADKLDEKCETDGYINYKATHKAPDTPDKTFEETGHKVVVPATGHKWPEAAPPVTWKWEGEENASARVISGTVQVTCENGDKHDGNDGILKITYAKTPESTEPDCTTEGKVTYTAKGTTTDAIQKEYDLGSDAQQTLNALGHDYAADAVFTWPEKAGDDNKGTVTGDSVTATLHCNRENEDIKGTVTVTAGKAEVPPTYEAPGYKYWTATAEFEDGKAGAPAVQKTDPDHPYEIAMLEPEYTSSVVDNTSGKVKPDATEDSLGEQVDALVEAALTQDKNNGLDDDLFKALQSAQEKTEDEDLSIETKLVVNDTQKATSTGGIDGVKNEDIQQVYDISIVVTVSGKTVGEQTGQITQTTEPITFSVDKPEGGPIWYVMRYHDGKWGPIDSRVDGDKIVFSSDKFSEFAIISSSDLAMAEVTPSAIPDQTYTGSPIQPKVELTINGGQKLTEGKDYVVAYENNTDVTDAARIVITPAEGSAFTGRIELTFKIVKAPAAGGSGSGTKPTEAPVPATGDETPVALYAAMLTLSAAALTLVLARRKRQK